MSFNGKKAAPFTATGRKRTHPHTFNGKPRKKLSQVLRDSAGDTYRPGARFDSAGQRIMGSRDSAGDTGFVPGPARARVRRRFGKR